MDLGLDGKKALVMGASSGLGKAIAQTLRQGGAEVAICARGKDRLEATALEIGASPMVCDLSQPEAGQHAVEQAEREIGPLDILITNTGGPPVGGFLDVSGEMWQQGFQGLWMSAVDGIRAALPGMQQRGWGRIVLVTSLAAKEPVANLTVSNALRAGLLGLTNTVSREVAAQGVTVNSVLPGYTKTERLAELGVSDEELSANIPAGRLGRPEELAALTAFLCSQWAGYITGQAISVDGGQLRGI